MSNKILVYKNRTNVINVHLGIDITGDTITSEIRAIDGTLIATWTVAVVGDGTAGDISLTLLSTDLDAIEHMTGIMDFKRVHDGEPLSVITKPLEVEFINSVTA